MFIILSPAKKLNTNCQFDEENISYLQFQQETFILNKILKRKSIQELKDLMSISENIAKLNYERNQNFSEEFTLKNSYPALFLFDGEAYNGLDASSFSEQDLEFAQKHLRILSGLYGLIRPLDLIQEYRLEMGTKLNNDKGNNLYKFWQSKLTQFFNNELSKSPTPFIINLASNEYSKAIDLKKINYPKVTVNFKENKNGKKQTIMVYAKNARGKMANFIIKNKIQDIESIKNFNLDGYMFDNSNQSNNIIELNFSRNHK